ncbi:MAG TPA: DUF4140 domain-containing protein, partial [Bacteroidales bacterium]|nr:DUF4140 domain-containing protein [Bacteroidales bacterium]
MKKIFFLLMIGIFSPAIIFCQEVNIIRLSPALNNVIVYMTGAQMRYKVTANLVKGRNTVVLNDFAPGLNPQSIKISAQDNVTLLSVSHKLVSSTAEAEKLKSKAINDSINILTKKIAAVNDQKNALTIQKDMLLKNQSLGGQSTGVNVAELQKAADFFQVRIFDINKQLTDLTADADSYSLSLSQLQLKAAEINSKLKTSHSEVTLLVNANSTQSSVLEVSY